MPAYHVQIADKVTADLNAAPLSLPFLAERAEAPVTEMEGLEDLAVSVVPGGFSSSVWDLNRRLTFSFEVGVWIQRLTDLGPEQTDPLRQLLEEVITLFLGQRLGVLDARCIAAETRDLPTPAGLDVTRVFTAGLFLTFRMSQP